MEELFGISTYTIMLVLLAIFIIVMGFVGVLAWRNRVMLKLGIRNVPKRRAQTVLIIFGLMLSTVIITSAFGTGDTMVYTIRSHAARNLGDTDEIIKGGDSVEGGLNYFDYSQYENLRDGLSDYEYVDGLVPAISATAPLVDISREQYTPSVTLFAPGTAYPESFLKMITEQGEAVTLDDLDDNEVYLDKEAAKDLKAEPGDSLILYLNNQPNQFKLKAILEDVSSGSASVVIIPLLRAQELLDKEDQINNIRVSNRGGQVGGAKYSNRVKDHLESLLGDTSLEVETVKKDALDEADLAGSIFTTMFVGFGLFSITAGLLLIFLIFMMLAAARKSEMGMARAVGTKGRHLIQMFMFEGTAYDLGAALVGVILGMAVTFGMANIMARIFQDTPLDLAYHFEPRSLVIAFTLGILVTFVTVTISSWRVSRLNIVRAIRDIPEPKLEKVGRRWLVIALLSLSIALIAAVGGFFSDQGASFHLGISLFIIGLALLLRYLGLGERPTFTLAGIALLVWWLLPFDAIPFLDELKSGMEMFFISGIMMVLGAVWVVIYNLNLLLRILTIILGRLKGVTPALKTAIAYPMKNRLRTGLTLAMFSLVIFTIVFMSVVIRANMAVLENEDSFSGGYDIQGTVSYINPIPDIQQAVNDAENLNAEGFEAIASQASLPLEIRQSDVSSEEWEQYVVNGVDDVYLDTNSFEFTIMTDEYDSPREVWQAVRDNPGYAVISADAVPSRNQFAVMVGGPEFRLEGLYQEDDVMSPINVEVRESLSGKEMELIIIGVLESISFNFGVYTSQDTLSQTWPSIRPTTYFFKLKDGVDVESTAEALESTFLPNGMETISIKELLDKISETSYAMSSLLQGFMSLGLVVGIAALGVISTRAVVERRHEIGVLRAIGYRRRTVQLSFLLESSIVALLGILIGVVLALLLSYNVIDFLKEDVEGLEFQIPWVQTLIIAGVAYAASLLMTFLPARQASKVYPAEALRYE